MKTTTRYFAFILAMSICLLSSFKSDDTKSKKKYLPPIVVTKDFTADNGVPGVASIQYNTGQLYTNVVATIQGVGTVNLTSVSHSAGTINVDKFEGYISDGTYEYHIFLTVTGNTSIGWQIYSATAETLIG
jgi:kynureninase